MRIPFFLLLLLGSACAQVWQVEVVDINAQPVSRLVNVSGDLDFGPMLAGYPYSTAFNVSWAVPQLALARFEGQNVTIFVSVNSKRTDPNVVFVMGGARYSSLSFSLYCPVEHGICVPGNSTLSGSFLVNYQIPRGLAILPGGGIVINATLDAVGDSVIIPPGPEPLVSEPVVNAAATPGLPISVSLVPVVDEYPKLPDAGKPAAEGFPESDEPVPDAPNTSFEQAGRPIAAGSPTAGGLDAILPEAPSIGLAKQAPAAMAIDSISGLVSSGSGSWLSLLALALVVVATLFFYARHKRQAGRSNSGRGVYERDAL